jgi:transposase
MQCMDRAALEQMLDEGLSLAEIGRRVERHEATVAYWLAKYGLSANGRERHAARGALSRKDLETLVRAGLSTSQIGETLKRSTATVRHWLREYGLATQRARRRQASSRQQRELLLDCPRHADTIYRRRRDGGYRCSKCASEAVSRRRRRIKHILVEDAGGSCRLCGYSRCVAALGFHHLMPIDKRFALSHRGVTRSLERAREEARKCVLLCANCHAEVEAGLVDLEGCAAIECGEPGEDCPG